MLWMMSILFLMEKFTKFVSTGKEEENSVSFIRVINKSVQKINTTTTYIVSCPMDSRKKKSLGDNTFACIVSLKSANSA